MNVLRFSNDLLDKENSEDLRVRVDEDGYLLFRGLLERDKVMGLRARIVEALKDLSWLDAQQLDPFTGTKCTKLPEATLQGAMDTHKWPIFDRKPQTRTPGPKPCDLELGVCRS